MIIKCVENTGKFIRQYEDIPLKLDQTGKFGVTEEFMYWFEIGEEFFVTGMVVSENKLLYLIDTPFRDGLSSIGLYPYQLFKVIDHRLPPKGWCFNTYALKDAAHPYTQAIWGYQEWCFDLHNEHYEGLVEMDEYAQSIYHKRKNELQDSLSIS